MMLGKLLVSANYYLNPYSFSMFITALLEIVLIEGRKRQVKRICAACGHPVERLRRTGFAFLTAEGLESGAFRPLSGAEVRRLYRLVGLPLACLS